MPTLVAIKAYLEKDKNLRPVFWLTRSLAIGDRIRDDADRVGLRVFVAGGREKCCNLYLEGEDIDPHNYCRFFRYKCNYYLNLEDLKKVWEVAESYKDILELLPHSCAYFTQERILSQYDVTVQNYFRRRFIGFTTIIDECHNLLVPREKRVKIEEITEAIALLKTATISRKAINSLDSLAHRIAEAPDESVIYPCSYVREEEADELNNLYIELLYRRKIPRCLRKLLEMISFQVLYKEGEVITGYRPPFIPKYNVALSGSVPESLIDFLKADLIIRVPWNKLKAFIIEGVTTKYGLETFNEYKLLLITSRRKFKKILAIAPSRRVKKRLYSDYEETEEAIEDWKKKGGLLTITARGKFSEGLDLDCNCVIIAGCPFLPPEISGYLRKSYRRLGMDESLAWKGPMLIATIQAIGRAYRGRGKKPIIILADERYKKYSKELEEYFEIEEIEYSKIIKSNLSKMGY